jgi:signal transduction histidine kinase
MGSSRDISERKRADEILKAYSAELEAEVQQRTQELRQAQEKLIRQERLAVLGQLAGGVSHELRNPLAVISNAAYCLGRIQPEAGATVKEYLQIITSEVDTANKIIADLLDFSRIKSAHKHPMVVAELVSDVLVRYPVPETVRVEIVIPAGLPNGYADQGQMIQVLGNLVVNASQAMPQGGRLAIAAARQEDTLAIAVTDSGAGILPEHMGKLFEPLFSTKSYGIGLGLAICKDLVEANGGRIEASSQPGKGATFVVYVPLAEKSEV